MADNHVENAGKNGNTEQKQFSLFREKSLEAVESPESLNDYLKVTSPSVWLVLAAVIVLLIGAVLWSIFGRIESTAEVAVIADDSQCVCLVPYDNLENVISCNSITIEGQEYTLQQDLDAVPEIISEDTNPYIRVSGNLEVGDVVVEVPVNAQLSANVYSGTIVTQSLQPISLLLQ